MQQFLYCYSAAYVILSSFEVQLQLLLQILITLLSCWYQLHRETFKECTTSWACDSGRESPTQSLLLMIYGKCTSLHFTSLHFISLYFTSLYLMRLLHFSYYHRWEYPQQPDPLSDTYVANYNAPGCQQVCKLPPGQSFCVY